MYHDKTDDRYFYVGGGFPLGVVTFEKPIASEFVVDYITDLRDMGRDVNYHTLISGRKIFYTTWDNAGETQCMFFWPTSDNYTAVSIQGCAGGATGRGWIDLLAL